jgi:hypothetical protein
MIGPLTFAIATALVAVGAVGGTALFRLRSAIDVMLAWALVASTIVVATVLVAGEALESLSPWLLLGLALITAAALCLAARASRRTLGNPLDRTLARVPAALGALRTDVWLAVLVAVTCAELLWRIVIGIVMPPYAGDALWYHLTTVASWIQAGRIGPSELSIWSTVHPQAGELLFAWTSVLLGDDRLVDLVQLPFAVLGAVGVAGIGRTCGLTRRSATAAGCLFLLTPIVLSQTTASYTDLMCIAFVLTSYHFLLRSLDALLKESVVAPTGAWLLLAGIAGGLAVGTKELALPYLAVLAGVLIVGLMTTRARHRTNPETLLLSLGAFVLPLLALGVYHYVETWVRFGSPTYPVRLSAFGFEIFKGRDLDEFLSTPPSEGTWWREIWGQWHADQFFLTHPRFHAYSYDGRPSGLGPLWSYLGFVALVAFGVRLAVRSRGLFWMAIVPVIVMFALQPYRWWSRFTMILAAFGAIAIMALLESLRGRSAVALKTAVAVLVGLGLFFPTLKIDGEFWATRILSIAAQPSDERTIGRVALSGYRWVDSVPDGARIGVDTSARQFGGQPYVLAYPLFGSNFEHEVHALPRTSAAAFRQAIARQEITYVFVARGGLLDRWMSPLVAEGCAQSVFEGEVYAGEAGRAYRLVPDCT